MTSSMLRRQLKNLVQNYSEAEVKVREATSNDPWGPSSTQMADISDLTYNVVACNEIMTMLWKRLKDDKNWRHIHKSLTLLEYLLKTGDDRVLLKMKDNIYIVKALTEYRFLEKDGKDQGVNVREKAKVVLVLMEDDEKLKEERDFAFKTREKTSKGAAASSADAIKDPNYKPCYVAGAAGLPSLDNIPSVADLTASFAARKEERLRQEAEKKDAERRAKMTDEELQWEDAGKGSGCKDTAWGGEKPETEEKSDSNEPKAATGPWGTSAGPDSADTAASSDAWGAPSKMEKDSFAADTMEEDAFAAPKNGEDPFNATTNTSDPFNAPRDKEDPFAAPKHKPDPFSSSDGDSFNTPKDDPFKAPKDDPFNASKDDPFNAPKDDPFNAPKDDPFSAPKEDPFNAPKDDPFNAPKDDPFNAPKHDPFNAPKEDPFNAPKDDPFNAPKDDPFKAPKDDPFSAPKEDPFNTPKDDPFTAPKDDPFTAPKEDPFNALKDDPFTAPKDDPFHAPKDVPFTAPKEDPFNAPEDDPFSAPKDDAFTAPASTPPKEDPFAEPMLSKDDPFAAPTSPPKEDPFSAPNKLSQDDPFAAPTTPPKEDPFSSPPKPTKDDPFTAPTTPPKEDPFAVPSTPPRDDPSDPFNAPPAGSPQDNKDTWAAPASSPPASSADPWDAPSAPGEDAWGNGASATSPMNNSDPFGDASQTDSDPWGAPAPVSTDDAWGAPAPPTDSSPSADPFGDGSSKSNDPWGAPSNANGNNTADRRVQEGETYRKTASFLGSAGASLVDLDDLFCSNPKPKQRSLANALATQTQAIGAFKARGMASAPTVRSGAFAEASAPCCNPFSSMVAPSPGAIPSAFGAAAPPSGAPLFQLPSHSLGVSHSALSLLQAAPQPDRGSLQAGLNPNSQHGAVGIVQSSFPASISWDPGAAHRERGGDFLSSRQDETDRKDTNPFMF